MGNGSFSQMAGDTIVRRRIGALAFIAAAVLAVVLLAGSGDEYEEHARDFAEAWAAQEFSAMHATLSPPSQAEHSVATLTRAYERAQEIATITGIGIEKTRSAIEVTDGDAVPVDLILRTRLFGDISKTLLVPISEDGIAWSPQMVFPGLEPGQELRRRTRAPARGSILTREGRLIAGGPPEARSGEIEGASQIAGTVAVPTGELAEAARERGFGANVALGTSGLELILDELVAGKPGGTLLATGGESPQVLARSRPEPGRDVETTIDAAAQAAATLALGSSFGGIAVLSPNGAIRGLAGIAFSAPQPPGSTFKIVTAAAALESGETSPGEEFPVVTAEVVGGREIENAHDSPCGGTLVESFAESCNTVFAPLGVRVGGERLVETAELLGFNQEPDLLAGRLIASGTAEPSTIPQEFASELDLGVSAIGQGQVLATPLGMASATQAIAAGGRRTPPFVYRDGAPERVRAMSGKTARQLTAMMEAVVAGGTGSSAQLPGIRVAGKTGTAELGPKPGQEIPPPDPDNPDAEPAELEQAVDAWFVSFAPVQRPRWIVAVMLVNADGDGGVVAAPVARQVLSSLLGGS